MRIKSEVIRIDAIDCMPEIIDGAKNTIKKCEPIIIFGTKIVDVKNDAKSGIRSSKMIHFNLEQLKSELIPAFESAYESLPDEVFTYISMITPLVNVDLLVRNEKGEVLLSWREDSRGSGWHIPGGIIRFKETAAHRIVEVARIELGAEVTHGADPIKITEIFVPERRRGHAISLLYDCTLTKPLDVDSFNCDKKENEDGFLRWFSECPDEIVFGQREAYRTFLEDELQKWQK